jgi:uracil-DNA glycosylase
VSVVGDPFQFPHAEYRSVLIGTAGGGTAVEVRSAVAVTASSGRLARLQAGFVTSVTPPQGVRFPAVGRSTEERRAELVELYRELNDQHGCPLAGSRTHVVFGMGNADADLMFVGEAPGATEDQEGKPFVGRAGCLLDELLGGIGLSRRDVFIANILMCRPPGNRDPLPEEIEECKPYLMRKIQLIEPKVIATLGNFATKTLTESPVGITRCCGRPQKREVAGLDVTIYPLFHPAAALRTPKVLEQLRGDFSRIPALLEEVREPVPASAEVTPEPPPQLGLFG